MTDNCR